MKKSKNRLFTIVFWATMLGFFFQSSAALAEEPCKNGWKPIWNKSVDRWQCAANMKAVCRGGVLRRQMRPPFLYFCQGTSNGPGLPLGPNCPTSTQYISTTGRCIGTYNLNCPTGYSHERIVVTRNSMNDRGEVIPYQCSRRIRTQETACHPEMRTFQSTQYSANYMRASALGPDLCNYTIFNGRTRNFDSGYPACRMITGPSEFAPLPNIIAINTSPGGFDQCVDVQPVR